MSDDVVFIRDSISSEHISCNSSNIQSLATWVSLDHWDHFWCCPISKTPNYTTLVVYLLMYEKWICIFACSTHFPSSFSLPTCTQACRPIEISVNMSAIFFCGSWFLARGFPNCILENKHRTCFKHEVYIPRYTVMCLFLIFHNALKSWTIISKRFHYKKTYFLKKIFFFKNLTINLSEIRQDWYILTDVSSREMLGQNFSVSTNFVEITTIPV